ncbi:uncharacterized protein LOC128673155 [Plodia interpunctella]|uniref:uncharacterized protein LOC128673155 n=1 Tax=Plodia interpunctella TaxID=58824 RepID=UPI002368544A|nr:uncharacterized protein LOC128673155 [Plodia interpunctella]XP_053606778.1 uncharacterized protein LOC128673155 [Plodia interpunctella]
MDARVAALLSIAVCVTAPYVPRRCILFQRVCVSHCPRLMHAYHTRCDRDTLSQRTCSSPVIHSIGFTCGWSRCDCNGPMMYDEVQGFCVHADECINLKGKKLKNKRRKHKNRISKKLRLDDEDEMMDKRLRT